MARSTSEQTGCLVPNRADGFLEACLQQTGQLCDVIRRVVASVLNEEGRMFRRLVTAARATPVSSLGRAEWRPDPARLACNSSTPQPQSSLYFHRDISAISGGIVTVPYS